ncbi:uncharacterized protein LOC114187406 isoform X2 [Vigna unguiculata]|uniref:uncharacterized protein LOC114187406 isoform X2 n=1 Tax=Vigna unguiculata TaxID=3917 RepID=UPI0010170F98|nr:uncharacterized protein LOC114187406 isoform X2 [Vigna unguiculata]
MEQELDPSLPCSQRLLSAILAMESSECLISHARECGGGAITEQVQQFIWNHCLSTPGDFHVPYLKNFLKKLIAQIEFDHGYVLDNLMIVWRREMPESAKEFRFFFLMVVLNCRVARTLGYWSFHCSVLETCLKVGSGVGLIGLCLAHVKASKVILSDGDLSTLANMKFNLEMNHLNVEAGMPQRNNDQNMVKCLYLPWESASVTQLQDIMPDVVLGADVIYDPVYQPHLVRVLAILLNPMSLKFCRQHASCKDITPNIKHENYEHNHEHAIDISHSRFKASHNDDSYNLLKEAPVAYISYVIRNIETFNYFMSLGKQAHLDIVDLTDSLKPLNLLCYMQSYNQANVRLLRITGNNIK